MSSRTTLLVVAALVASAIIIVLLVPVLLGLVSLIAGIAAFGCVLIWWMRRSRRPSSSRADLR